MKPVSVQAGPDAAPQPAADSQLDVARMNAEGNLLRPEDLESWIFLGSSLGMGYNDVEFNPDRPGMFQIVTVEPKAWAYFLKYGSFAQGTMFALHYYGATQRKSTNRAGYVLDTRHAIDIHLLDKQRFPEDGHNFFNLPEGADTGQALSAGNACVACHDANAEMQGVFTQFYPPVQTRLNPGAQDHAHAM